MGCGTAGGSDSWARWWWRLRCAVQGCGINQPGRLHVFEVREVSEAFQAEVVQELFGGHVGERCPLTRAAWTRSDQPYGSQVRDYTGINRAAKQALKVSASHRLVVGDGGEQQALGRAESRHCGRVSDGSRAFPGHRALVVSVGHEYDAESSEMTACTPWHEADAPWTGSQGVTQCRLRVA